MEIRGASALVSGAGRGIGRAIALALGREGAAVTAVARTASELERLAAELRAGGVRVRVYAADLRRRDAGDGAVAAAVEAHGGLQILVNNAGVGLHAALAETTDEQWDDVLATNLTAVFRLTRAALPHLARGGGHVFMISSLAATNVNPGLSVYSSTKAGLDQLARCLMLEVRHEGVKVTTIAPGSVDTSFGGAPRNADWMLRPEDVAEAVVSLLRTRDDAHLSRVEMRPARPPRRA